MGDKETIDFTFSYKFIVINFFHKDYETFSRMIVIALGKALLDENPGWFNKMK